MYGEYIILLKPLHPVVVMCDVSATLILDNTKVGQTEWKLPSNHAWDQVFMIDLDKVSEVPHCLICRFWCDVVYRCCLCAYIHI